MRQRQFTDYRSGGWTRNHSGDPVFKLVAGKRLLYRPLTGTTEVLSVGIARASKGDVTPAGENFCEILRKISKGVSGAKPKSIPVRLKRVKRVVEE